jgi:hypothetical protein
MSELAAIVVVDDSGGRCGIDGAKPPAAASIQF